MLNAPGDSAEWLRENPERLEHLAESDHDLAAAARILLAIQREEEPDADDLAETRETVKPFIDTDGTADREQYVRAPAAGRDSVVSPGERRAFAAAVHHTIHREDAERAARERAGTPVDFQMYRVGDDGVREQVEVSEVVE